ncbi:MAG: hypothetical protein ACI4G0_01740 [Ruminococcus sp.]
MSDTVILAVGYITSVIITWWLIGIGYRKLYFGEKPTETDILLMLLPIINILLAASIIIELFLKKIDKPFIEWFFRQ